MKQLSILVAALAVLSLIEACNDMGTFVQYRSGPITEDYRYISDPRARWQAYKLKDYVLEQQHACFCPYGGETCRVYVRNNSVVDVVKKSDGQSIFADMPERYKTVDQLFDLASSLNPDSLASLEIQYDSRYGYPRLISVDVNSLIIDEEYAYITISIERLQN